MQKSIKGSTKIYYNILGGKKLFVFFGIGVFLISLYTDMTLWQLMLEYNHIDWILKIQRGTIYIIIMAALYLNVYLILRELLYECNQEFHTIMICGKIWEDVSKECYHFLSVYSTILFFLSGMIFMLAFGHKVCGLGFLTVVFSYFIIIISLFGSCKICFRSSGKI